MKCLRCVNGESVDFDIIDDKLVCKNDGHKVSYVRDGKRTIMLYDSMKDLLENCKLKQ